MAEIQDIPQPSGLPILGNLTSIDGETPIRSFEALADQYGEIYRLRFPAGTAVVISTQALVNDACDEKRFKKCVNSSLKQVRHGVHDGLFTAFAGEENWGIAHRVLMPAFGPLSIRGMFDEMHDVASQLALKWARHGPDSQFNIVDDFTRLALDTLALCSMGYRFNSYYSETMHPFIEAMGDFLLTAGKRGRRPLPAVFYRAQDEKFAADIEVLRSTAKGVLESRKSGNDERKDLLAAMLKGRDSQTGKKMTDESIMDNLITFLVAGHETTSGLLSFTTYYLAKHPEALQKAQKEVDSVIGKGVITVEHLSKLPYLDGVLREAIRLSSTLPNFTVEPNEDTLLGGKYPVKKGETILLLLTKSHLDPRVFGPDASEFKPERMMDDNFFRLNREYPNCWKPFGNGMRACIGRPFAWQESLLAIAMLLQNFNLILTPGYVLDIKQTLTIKPKDLYFRALLRDGLTATSLERRLNGSPNSDKAGPAAQAPVDTAAASANAVPLTVLYGSNSGTCEAMAQRIAMDALSHNFRIASIDCLDSAKGSLPKDHPVIIVTASYEGQAPDNAGHFVTWIKELHQEDALKDVSFAVFGCGHKDWVQTYHKIPKFVDSQLEKLGATRIASLGLADASSGDMFSDFESWEDTTLWPALFKTFGVSSDHKAAGISRNGLQVAITKSRSTTLRQDVKEAAVVETHTLMSGDATTQAKKHIEIKVPEGITYTAGDYLAVLPMNPMEIVHRVLRRFGLARDDHVQVSADGGPTTLPVDAPVGVTDLFGSYVELSQPATKRNILGIAEHATDDKVIKELNALATDDYADEVKAKRVSTLDLLERFPDIALPLSEFLSMLPPMRVRQYSISSSPLWKPQHVTLTFSVLRGPALSGSGQHIGVATSFLDSLSAHDTLQVALRPSQAAFSLPSDPGNTPIICIAAGSGLAPFRGFIQERAIILSTSTRALAPALLFFGCRSTEDDIYRTELDEWEKLGAVQVFRSYSRDSEHSEGCKYVSDSMWKHRERVLELWRRDAKVYVCGSRAIAESTKDVILKIYDTLSGGVEKEQAEAWFESFRNTRYVTDVFD